MLRFDPVPVLRRYALHARLLWRSSPALSLCCLTLVVLAASARTAALVTTGQLVGALAAARSPWLALTATATLFVVAPVASSLASMVSRDLSARYLVDFVELTMEAGTHPYGIAHLENPRDAGRLEALGRAPRDWLFLAGIDAGWTLLSIRLGGVGAFVVLVGWSWWAALLVLAGWQVYGRAFGRWSITIFDELLDVTGQDRRRAHYYRSLLVEGPSAKEIRLFGLTGWLVDRYVTSWQTAMRAVWAHRNAGLRGSIVVLAVPLATNVVAFVLLLHEAGSGSVSAGLLVTLCQAMLAMEAFGPQNDPQQGLARTTSAIAELARMRTEQGLSPLTTTSETVARQVRSGPAEIRLDDVAFTYPTQDRPALNGLSLHIPAGQALALVGLNGAGKSTLIKLLCGLERPDRGTVRIDGADPGRDDATRRRVGVIFQEFVRYHLSLRENVGIGALDHLDDPPLLERALTDAGSSTLLRRLEHGWDTVLSSEYDDGTDLSGGQWQRVALARALAALGRGAGVLVLDEPTAALDIRAEAALFERFLAVARGATTILVSHRLSSVRRAERIVVLADTGDGARIVEDGSHDELMQRGGRYAQLFALQASRFEGGDLR